MILRARRKITILVCWLIPFCLLAGASAVIMTADPVIQPVVHWYNGVALASAGELAPYIKAAGTNPQIVTIYVSFGAPFPTAEVKAIAADHAMPLIELDPKHETLKAIAGGGYDDYLRSFEASRAASGVRTAIDFGHEPNGYWYPWSCRDVKNPGLYITAWRDVHAAIGTTGVTWVWAVNAKIPDTCPLQPLYPGNRYVNWVGIDGYLRYPDSTFQKVFGETIGEIRAFTGRPLLIAEAGAVKGKTQASLITSLYSGAHAWPGVIGVVYFDHNTAKGAYRPQGNRKAMRAYRAENKIREK